MKYKITKKQYNSKNCFVCGVDNHHGLHTSFYETETGELIAVSNPEFIHQSYPGRLHGGVASALLDEVMGRSISVNHGETVWGITIEMNLKYRKPVPYGCPVKAIGRVTKDMGRMFEATGELILPDGKVAVNAYARYLKQSAEKIAGTEYEQSDWGFTDTEAVPYEIEL